MEIVDNFLPHNDFVELQHAIVWNDRFPWSIVKQINDDTLTNDCYNWYAIHMFYENDAPLTAEYHELVRPILTRNLVQQGRLRSLIRAKANFYGYTPELISHQPHADYDFSHSAAILSLNTCDGHTNISGEIVESVANRIVFFDGSVVHNSTSTTNQKGRFNINLNFL